MTTVLDALALLSLDLRADRQDEQDPVVPVARWLWWELRVRQVQREQMRAALARAPDEPPRLELWELAS